MNGIKYFKLLNPKYGDDSTKGCALTGAEIDGNFNFLRGYDVQDVKLVDGTVLRVERVNGDVISIDLQNDEIRRNVEQLNERTSVLENQASAMSETVAEQGQTISEHTGRIIVLENDSATLSAKTINHDDRISQLETEVRELTIAKNNLEEAVSRLSDIITSLQLNGVRGTTFVQKVNAQVADFIHGDRESVDFDAYPNREAPTHIDLRFGENARFIAGIPDASNED